MSAEKIVVGAAPPESPDKLFFNITNNTLNFFNPDSQQWEKCCGVYAADNIEIPK